MSVIAFPATNDHMKTSKEEPVDLAVKSNMKDNQCNKRMLKKIIYIYIILWQASSQTPTEHTNIENVDFQNF